MIAGDKIVTVRNRKAPGTSAPTVAVTALRALLRFAESKGAPREALAIRAGIVGQDLDDPKGRVPFATYVLAMRAAKELSGDSALALHFGESIDMTELSFAMLIRDPSGNGTLADAFAQWNRYSRLVIDIGGADGGERMVLRRQGAEVWLIDTRPDPNDFPELTESAFARMASTSRRLFGGRTFITGVHVTHAAPAYRAEYERVFGVPVWFGAAHNAIVTDPEWMSREAPVAPPIVSDVLRAHADVMLDQLEQAKTTRGRVEEILAELVPAADASIERVASRLAVSRQTLFRRLRDEGVTFERVLDDLRHRLALRYLGTEEETVQRTAYLLGFSDSAAFSRAFKRWTGSSPTSERRNP